MERGIILPPPSRREKWIYSHTDEKAALQFTFWRRFFKLLSLSAVRGEHTSELACSFVYRMRYMRDTFQGFKGSSVYYAVNVSRLSHRHKSRLLLPISLLSAVPLILLVRRGRSCLIQLISFRPLFYRPARLISSQRVEEVHECIYVAVWRMRAFISFILVRAKIRTELGCLSYRHIAMTLFLFLAVILGGASSFRGTKLFLFCSDTCSKPNFINLARLARFH